MKLAQIISGIILSSAFFVSGTASAQPSLAPPDPRPTNPLNAAIGYGVNDNTAPIAVAVSAGEQHHDQHMSAG